MSQENQITLRGYVTVEPKIYRTTQTQTPVAEFRVGSTPRWPNRLTGEWEDGEPTYYSVKCWRSLALNIKASLHKGDQVLIRGKFITRTWVDNQQRPRIQVQIEADSVGHDLTFGYAIFTRGGRTARQADAGLAAGEMARSELGQDDQGAADGPPEEDAQRDDALAGALATESAGESVGGDTPGDPADVIDLEAEVPATEEEMEVPF